MTDINVAVRRDKTEEWQRAEANITRVLGFRIIRIPGYAKERQEDRYQYQTLYWDAKGKERVIAVRPTEASQYVLWEELIRSRIEHDAAASLAWRIYSKAMGVTVSSFNGIPAGQPEEAVAQQRRMYEQLESEIEKLAAFLVGYGGHIEGSAVDSAIALLRAMGT